MKKTLNDVALEAESRLIALCVEDISRIDRVEVDTLDFVDVGWRACIEELRRIRDESGDVDALVLADAILLKFPKMTYGDLVNIEASAPLIEEYSRIVSDEACKRRLRLGISGALSRLDAGESIEEALSATAEAITDSTSGEKSKALSIGRMVEQRCLELADIAERKAKGDVAATGLMTGIDGLDEILGGLQLGIPTLCAARPAMGKSALALNISEHVSESGIGVHVFSLEDTRSNYADRIISYHSRVSTSKIRTVDLNEYERRDIAGAMQRAINRKHWIVDDRSGVTANEIIRSVRMEAAANETQLVIVDYMQLLAGSPGQEPRQMLTQAINAFGDAAKRDNMAYFLLSQLNRGLEQRPDKRPILSDIKECGALEERSKCVIMVYRDAVYNPPDEGDRFAKEKERSMELLIRKNSNGQTGFTEVEWIPEMMRIR